jgi:hypothetical protein
MSKSEVDDLDRPLNGAKAFLPYVPCDNVKQVYYGLAQGWFDANKFGKKKWTSTPRRLLAQFAGRKGTPAELSPASEDRGAAR